jgi:tetratricopeptide (TPR) repeat protein
MQDFYQKGDATQALSYFDKLSPKFIEQYNLAKKASTMREVGRLATKALQDRSSALAQDVLIKEPNYRNAYHKQMAALKAELDKEKRDRATKLYEWGEEFANTGKHEDALKTFFEARQADPDFAPPLRRHSDMGSILMRQAHRLPLTREYAEEKRRIYNLIIKNSFPEDSIHSQAENLLKEIDS